jgi:hypothetical protein
LWGAGDAEGQEWDGGSAEGSGRGWEAQACTLNYGAGKGAGCKLGESGRTLQRRERLSQGLNGKVLHGCDVNTFFFLKK